MVNDGLVRCRPCRRDRPGHLGRARSRNRPGLPLVGTPPLRVPPVVRQVQALALPPKVELRQPEPEKPKPEPPKPAPEPAPASKAAPEPPKPEPPKAAPPVVAVGAFALNESARAS